LQRLLLFVVFFLSAQQSQRTMAQVIINVGNTAPVAPPAPVSAHWSSDLTGCCSDIGVCFRVLLCCGCEATTLRASMEKKPAGLCDYVCGCMFMIPYCWLCACSHIGNTRSMFKREYNINDIDGQCDTCLLAPCALCQMQREVKIRQHQRNQPPAKAMF
jgi:Cys-rich protein (TIGR01571 family)